MKKIRCILLCCIFLCSFTACQEDKTIVMSLSNYDGIHEVRIEVSGDEVEKITQTSKLEIEGYSEDQVMEIVNDLQLVHETLEKGITFSVLFDGTYVVKTYTLNASSKKAIEAANGYGFFEFSAGTKEISLKTYKKSLEAKGFQTVEEITE